MCSVSLTRAGWPAMAADAAPSTRSRVQIFTAQAQVPRQAGDGGIDGGGPGGNSVRGMPCQLRQFLPGELLQPFDQGAPLHGVAGTAGASGRATGTAPSLLCTAGSSSAGTTDATDNTDAFNIGPSSAARAGSASATAPGVPGPQGVPRAARYRWIRTVRPRRRPCSAGRPPCAAGAPTRCACRAGGCRCAAGRSRPLRRTRRHCGAAVPAGPRPRG